jgi:hypothetical protein
MHGCAVAARTISGAIHVIAFSCIPTVVFFIIPVGIFDLASLSFQVPIFGFSAELTANPTKHNIIINTIDRVFMLPPV